jgi:uncharacterized protein YjbI with pentapeptide repeats
VTRRVAHVAWQTPFVARTGRLPTDQEEAAVERDILCGKHLCQESVIDDSEFINVGMSRVRFDDACMEDASFTNINMQRATIHYVNLKGARITNCHLVGVAVEGGEIEGMTIDGVLVTDMLAAYRSLRNGQRR